MSTASKKAEAKAPFTTGYYDKAWVDEALEMDESLRKMSVIEVMKLDGFHRVRWFYLLQVNHYELQRVSENLYNLLQPYDEYRIITVAGMTSVGKTALAKGIVPRLVERMYGSVPACYLSTIYSRAPANGDTRFPWRTLYYSWLESGHEPFIERKREIDTTGGVIHVLRGRNPTLQVFRQALEKMLEHRRVKALILDEVLHLLRFEDYAACMDTLKDLSDKTETKFVLFGPYQAAHFMSQYGQAMSRSALIHFRRYVTAPTKFNDCQEGPRGFQHVAATLEKNWPCSKKPPLAAMCEKYLFSHCYGGVGLLKKFALRLLSLQLLDAQEDLKPSMFNDAGFPIKFREQLAREVSAGEELIYGACYGQTEFGTKEALEDIARLMREAA